MLFGMMPEQIREFRQSKSLTQQQFAELLGVTFVTLNRWENGQVKPSPMGLSRLRRLMDETTQESGRETTDIGVSPSIAPQLDFLGDASRLRLLVEAERLSYGHLFNPAFATEISRIDPLPHQRIAVYEKMLPQSRLRYLLADDAGAGKTIMTGLYIRESLTRRTMRRILIVVPAGLVGNWRRELANLFQLRFKVVTGADAKNGNPFHGPDSDLVVVSLDSLRSDRLFGCLRDPGVAAYDLAVFDEAHKLSARRDPVGTFRPTARYRLAEAVAGVPELPEKWKLPWAAQHLLLLTATPHMGKSYPYYCLWRLLEPEILSTEIAFNKFSLESRGNHFIRRIKEEMVDLRGAPLFPQRLCDTVKYELAQGSVSEQALYDRTTDYIKHYYNQAGVLNRQAARFAMTIFQRRLASSTWALLCSLRRRLEKLDKFIEEVRSGGLQEHEFRRWQNRLEERARNSQLVDVLAYRTAEEETALDGEEESEKHESEALGAFVATNLAELLEERGQVQTLVVLAEAVHASGNESKFDRMSELLRSPNYRDEKVIIYTEHKDTLDFLVRRLEGMGYAGQVACIHGGLDFRQRDAEVERFRARHDARDEGARFFVGTDAAAEGINLQFCWILINYDVPWNPARLEQRMGRIHRYGQKRDKVSILNLVAENTREGRVVSTLLEKLEEIRRQLGSDKVFDVIGRIFENMDLQDYMRRAVESDDEAESEAIRRLGELAPKQVLDIGQREETIYGRGGEVKNLLPQLRQSLEIEELRQLLPGYVRLFLENAAPVLGMDVLGNAGGEFTLRPRSKEALDSLMPLLEDYPAPARFTVYRPVHRTDVIFVHPGEPVFDHILSQATKHCQVAGQRGAIFTDVSATQPYLLHVARVSVVRSAEPGLSGFHARETLEQRLVGLKQFQDERQTEVSVEQFLLLRPAQKASPGSMAFIADAETWRDKAIHSIGKNVLQRLVNLQQTSAKNRQEENAIHLRRSFDFQESELATARKRLTGKVREGDRRAEADLERLKVQQRGLKDRRRLAIERARKEVDLIRPGGVEIIATALVQPSQNEADKRAHDLNAERIAMEMAIAHEVAHKAEVKDVSTPDKSRIAGLGEHPGFDLLSKRPEGDRSIEVKGRAGSSEIEISENEWRKACNLQSKYWLYCVFDCGTPSPRLLKVCDPFSKLMARARAGVDIAYSEIRRAAETE